MTGFWRFSSGFGEKEEKRAQRPLKSVEGLVRRLSGQTGSNPGSSFRISSPKKTKKSSSFACLAAVVDFAGLRCHASSAMDTLIGAVGRAVHAVPADIIAA